MSLPRTLYSSAFRRACLAHSATLYANSCPPCLEPVYHAYMMYTSTASGGSSQGGLPVPWQHSLGGAARSCCLELKKRRESAALSTCGSAVPTDSGDACGYARSFCVEKEIDVHVCNFVACVISQNY